MFKPLDDSTPKGLVHFSWYGELSPKHQAAAIEGPIEYATQFPKQTFIYWCQENQQEVFNEIFKDHSNIKVMSIDFLLNQYQDLEGPTIPDRIRKILAEVTEERKYFNLGKEFSQFMALAVYGGYHLDTTIKPNPENHKEFTYYPYAIQFGGIEDSSADVWATYVPPTTETKKKFSHACTSVIKALLNEIEDLKAFSSRLGKSRSLTDLPTLPIINIGEAIGRAAIRMTTLGDACKREIGCGRQTTITEAFSGIKKFGLTRWIDSEDLQPEYPQMEQGMDDADRGFEIEIDDTKSSIDDEDFEEPEASEDLEASIVSEVNASSTTSIIAAARSEIKKLIQAGRGEEQDEEPTNKSNLSL